MNGRGDAADVPARRLPLLLALIALASLAACRGGPLAGDDDDDDGDEPVVSRERIVIPRAAAAASAVPFLRDRRPVSPDDEAWDAKLTLARDYSAGGYDAQALDVVRAALALDPPAPWSQRFADLAASLRVIRIEDELLRAEVAPIRDYVVFGEPVDFEIRLRNVGREPLSLMPPEVGASRGDVLSPGAVTLDVRRVDRDIYASRMERSWTQNFLWHRPEEGPTRLDPGAVRRIPVRIPAEEVGPAIAGLRQIVVEGTLRPARVVVGDRTQPLTLRVRPGFVIVLPRNYEGLVADPIGAMGRSIDAVAPVHLLVASEFVPRDRGPDATRILARSLSEGDPSMRRAALAALERLRERLAGRPLRPLGQPLIDALGASPAREAALMEGLAALSGHVLAADARLWRDWWTREVPDSRPVVAPEPARDSRRSVGASSR